MASNDIPMLVQIGSGNINIKNGHRSIPLKAEDVDKFIKKVEDYQLCGSHTSTSVGAM